MKYINNLKKIEIFKEVVLCGSISQAANRLGLTQPAVSSAITNFESDLGFTLFKRSQGGAALTPEALHLMTAVEKLLVAANNFEELIPELRNGHAGKVNIACMPGFASTIVPNIISRLILKYPHIKAAYNISDSVHVQEGVRNGRFDIGVAELPSSSRELNIFPLKFELVVILPCSHPLAEKCSIDIQDLDKQPFIALDEQHFLAHEIKNQFIKEQCSFNVVAEAHLFSSIALMVSEGLGLSLVDKVTAKKVLNETHGRIVMRPFKPTLHLPIGILLPASAHISKSVMLLNSMLQSELQQLAES